MSDKRAFTVQAVESGGYNVVGPNFYSAPVADYSTASNLAAQLNYAHAVGHAAFAPTPGDIARMHEATEEDVAKLKAEFFERFPVVKQWYELLALYEKQHAFAAMPVRRSLETGLSRVDKARALAHEARAGAGVFGVKRGELIVALADAVELLAAECEQLRATCNARVRE